jgi:hypothetical protein
MTAVNPDPDACPGGGAGSASIENSNRENFRNRKIENFKLEHSITCEHTISKRIRKVRKSDEKNFLLHPGFFVERRLPHPFCIARSISVICMCPNEATTSTWLNSQRSEERTQEDTMNPASEAG